MSSRCLDSECSVLLPEISLAGGLSLLARAGLAGLFVVSAVTQIQNYAGVSQSLQAAGLPSLALNFAIALQVIAGLLLLLGLHTRWSALNLAVFSMVVAVWLHGDFAQPQQQLLFFKHLAIAGGLLLLAAHGPGPYSWDRHLGRDRELVF